MKGIKNMKNIRKIFAFLLALAALAVCLSAEAAGRRGTPPPAGDMVPPEVLAATVTLVELVDVVDSVPTITIQLPDKSETEPGAVMKLSVTGVGCRCFDAGGNPVDFLDFVERYKGQTITIDFIDMTMGMDIGIDMESESAFLVVECRAGSAQQEQGPPPVQRAETRNRRR